MGSFGQLVRTMSPESKSIDSLPRFGEAIRGWIAEARPEVVLEVGGGRHPLLSSDEASAMGISRYLVNDLSATELDHLPSDRERACFDIQIGPPHGSDYEGTCDLVFAHMVMEHVADPAAAWRTMHRLLRPGGAAVSLNPVLFSPPFLVNRLLPERLTRSVLERAFPRRNDDDHPKFPAYYRWCRASPSRVQALLSPIGFSSVDVVPLYGHEYFDRIPLVRTVDGALSEAARRRSWPSLASYAYVVAVR